MPPDTLAQSLKEWLDSGLPLLRLPPVRRVGQAQRAHQTGDSAASALEPVPNRDQLPPGKTESLAQIPTLAEIQTLLRTRGLDPCTLDLEPLADKAALLAALHQALDLGPWFGFNWDALEEALQGPEDRAAPERVLVCVGFQAFHARAVTAAEVFLDIVATVAANPDSNLRGCILFG